MLTAAYTFESVTLKFAVAGVRALVCSLVVFAVRANYLQCAGRFISFSFN
jgi:hypothetical protein